MLSERYILFINNRLNKFFKKWTSVYNYFYPKTEWPVRPNLTFMLVFGFCFPLTVCHEYSEAESGYRSASRVCSYRTQNMLERILILQLVFCCPVKEFIFLNWLPWSRYSNGLNIISLSGTYPPVETGRKLCFPRITYTWTIFQQPLFTNFSQQPPLSLFLHFLSFTNLLKR